MKGQESERDAQSRATPANPRSEMTAQSIEDAMASAFSSV